MSSDKEARQLRGKVVWERLKKSLTKEMGVDERVQLHQKSRAYMKMRECMVFVHGKICSGHRIPRKEPRLCTGRILTKWKKSRHYLAFPSKGIREGNLGLTKWVLTGKRADCRAGLGMATDKTAHTLRNPLDICTLFSIHVSSWTVWDKGSTGEVRI